MTISASTNFIHHGRFQVDHDASRNVFASTGLAEESVESIIATSDGLVSGHLTVRLNSSAVTKTSRKKTKQ